MKTIKVDPLVVGTQYTVGGSGYEGPYIKVTVTYTNRSEMYKATVARAPVQEASEDDRAFSQRQEAWAMSGFKPGDFSLTEWAEEEGPVEFIVWDYPQRAVLASLKVESHGR